jgi:hypothetical protein
MPRSNLKIYLRYEGRRGTPSSRRRLVGYADEACQRHLWEWPWHYGIRPTRESSRKSVNCNGSRYEPVWLDDYVYDVLTPFRTAATV